MTPKRRQPPARLPISTPAWVRDAVFYQIFPDRFATSERVRKPANLEPWGDPPTVHGYKGGDLLGVVERLDYLQDLGVSALYFNPVFASASNHRYHTHDYHQVDPMLGGNAALRVLLDEAHARGMKVVLDGVFNHASRSFLPFADILENGEKSAYLDWFHIEQFPLNAYGGGELGYRAWWGLPALPKFDTDTAEVREFLLDVAVYWLEFGIDGWRLDVPNEIDDDAFWQEFRRRCRAIKDDCYIVGEIWGHADRWLQGDQFDAVMNYAFTRAVFGLVASRLNTREIAKSGYNRIVRLDARAFADEIETLLARYPRAVVEVQFNLLGSHDTPRALTSLCGDEDALRMALLLLLTFPGTPCIYYGDEIGLEGGHDPHCRQAFPWHDRRGWNLALHDYLKRLIALRSCHAALRQGEFTTLHAEGELFVYARHAPDGEAFLGIVNTGEEQRRLDLELNGPGVAGASLEGRYYDVLGGLVARLDRRRLIGLDAPARAGVLYRREDVEAS